MSSVSVIHVETRTHGRVVVRAPEASPPWPALVGFHGYAEDAETHLHALARIPGADAWLLASVQALHPFYTRQQKVVANWMTAQDRELAIADNVDYVGRALHALRERHGNPRALVFAGFSQGGAMAYRAAARYDCSGLLILAADVPPDVGGTTDVTLPPVLIGRGTGDEWYSREKHAADILTLSYLRTHVESCVFEGGHEWTNEFYEAAGRFLAGVLIRT